MERERSALHVSAPGERSLKTADWMQAARMPKGNSRMVSYQ